MKTEQIYQHKQKTIADLLELRFALLAKLYQGSCEFLKAKEIRRNLVEETLRIGKKRHLPPDYQKRILTSTLKVAKELEKKQGGFFIWLTKIKGVKETNLTFTGLIAATSLSEYLNKKKIDKKTQEKLKRELADLEAKEIEKIDPIEKDTEIPNQIATEQEAEEKKKEIDDELAQMRRLDQPKVFYLISAHGDCAEDHLDYQGTIYIDKKWEDYIVDTEFRKTIRAYIKAHRTLEYQWVLDKPVWMMTRPNCRHYSMAMNTWEVLNSTPEEMLQNHEMIHDVGPRMNNRQNIPHSTNKKWYTERNILNIIKKYKTRLKKHQAMYQINPKSAVLYRIIEKEKMLIAKWENYYNQLKASNGFAK